jgi:hypothetical protein
MTPDGDWNREVRLQVDSLTVSTFGKAWAQRPVWAAGIVVVDPFTEDSAQMSRIERHDVVQTFATNGSDQSFAMCVGRRHANSRSQYVEAPTLHFFIETGAHAGETCNHDRPGSASRSCCRVHSAVGCSVTLILK